jgi:hypothetical protein
MPRQDPEVALRGFHELENSIGEKQLRVGVEVGGNCVESSTDCGESFARREVGGLDHGFERGDDGLDFALAGEC